jgi:hypothetical protein
MAQKLAKKPAKAARGSKGAGPRRDDLRHGAYAASRRLEQHEGSRRHQICTTVIVSISAHAGLTYVAWPGVEALALHSDRAGETESWLPWKRMS